MGSGAKPLNRLGYDKLSRFFQFLADKRNNSLAGEDAFLAEADIFGSRIYRRTDDEVDAVG